MISTLEKSISCAEALVANASDTPADNSHVAFITHPPVGSCGRAAPRRVARKVTFGSVARKLGSKRPKRLCPGVPGRPRYRSPGSLLLGDGEIFPRCLVGARISRSSLGEKREGFRGMVVGATLEAS